MQNNAEAFCKTYPLINKIIEFKYQFIFFSHYQKRHDMHFKQEYEYIKNNTRIFSMKKRSQKPCKSFSLKNPMKDHTLYSYNSFTFLFYCSSQVENQKRSTKINQEKKSRDQFLNLSRHPKKIISAFKTRNFFFAI